MKSLLIVLLRAGAFGAIGLLQGSVAQAAPTTQSYLMWQMPTSGIQFPIYVFANRQQVAYLYGPAQQAFVGPYSAKTSGSYTLYYQNNGAWFSCNLVIAGGAINNVKTTCPGAVINPPLTPSNVYTVAFGAIPWSSSEKPTVTPVNTNYGNRRITFRNSTNYPMIQIGEHCTESSNPNNPNCVNTDQLFQILKGASAVFTVDDKQKENIAFPAGLISYGFTVTAYKNAKGIIVPTGGYSSGNPYATKIELTSLPVNTTNGVQIPTGATNFDISIVDGYNINVRAYPEQLTYCTYTFPPENSNILGASAYSARTPLAAVAVSASTCIQSSQLPLGNKQGTPWNLTVNNDAQGCMSPCTYATKNGQQETNLFCCTGSYATPKSCDMPPQQLGANNSTYVQNLTPPVTKNVYRFAYDDAIGDFACPAETNFMIDFIPNLP